MNYFYCEKCGQKFEFDFILTDNEKHIKCEYCNNLIDLSKTVIYRDDPEPEQNIKVKNDSNKFELGFFPIICYYISSAILIFGTIVSASEKSLSMFVSCLAGSFFCLFCGKIIEHLQIIIYEIKNKK